MFLNGLLLLPLQNTVGATRSQDCVVTQAPRTVGLGVSVTPPPSFSSWLAIDNAAVVLAINIIIVVLMSSGHTKQPYSGH